MSNYITNRVDLKGSKENIRDLIRSLESDESEIDFNKIIPMPESLNIESGTKEEQAIAVYNYKEKGDDKKLKQMLSYPWVVDEKIKTCEELCNYFLRRTPNLIELGKTYVENLEKYGATTWYDWCCDNWGTKWNACEPWTDVNAFGFQTAWSNVSNLMVIVSERFPDIEMNYAWADEDFGYNVGRMTIKNGKIIKRYIPTGGSDEAYELATDILGYDARDEWED